MEKNISKDHAVAEEQLEDLQDDINTHLRRDSARGRRRRLRTKNYRSRSSCDLAALL
jgi:hypothetical protein